MFLSFHINLLDSLMLIWSQKEKELVSVERNLIGWSNSTTIVYTAIKILGESVFNHKTQS